MAHVGEKAISSEKVITKCPYCGALQKETIWVFKSDLDNDEINHCGVLCFNCHSFYIRHPNGKCSKSIIS